MGASIRRCAANPGTGHSSKKTDPTSTRRSRSAWNISPSWLLEISICASGLVSRNLASRFSRSVPYTLSSPCAKRSGESRPMAAPRADATARAATSRVCRASTRNARPAAVRRTPRGRHERRFRRTDLLAFMGVADRASPSPPHNHFCELYTSDLGRARGAAAFLSEGLQSDARCLVAADKQVQRAVIAQLEQHRPAIRRDLKAGRLVVAEYRTSGVAQLAYWSGRMHAALKTGPPRGDMAGALSAGGPARL